MRRWIAVAAFLLPPLASALSANGFAGWAMSRGRLVTIGAPPQGSLPVGSLQKPFIARAWAQSHGAGEPPTYLCSSASKCWRPAGHGRMDLRSAVRESCNTYFRELARETDGGALAATFRDAGFEWSGEMTAAEAIGLPGPSRVRIAPERLLDAYQDLGRTPWPSREDVRQQLLAGLRDAAQDGTAQGLNAWGLLAKTGTVPALDGAPLKTTGFALAMDDSGFAFLGMLDRGTGREAATRAASEIAKLRPGLVARETNARSAPSATRPHSNRARGVLDPVSVDMLGELRLSRISIRNAGASPVNSSRGYVGPGAEVEASPGDRFDTGLWRITSKRPAFERSVEASLIVTGRDEQRRIVASMTVREYADGVIKAELGPATPELRAPLAEAALRFLARGPRHAAADVCDSTHCAWFVGRGPVPRWLRPDRAVHDATAASLTDAEWRQASGHARERPEGPDQWTGDCGGDPASPHFIWGNGDRRVLACPRHPKGSGRPWRRDWRQADLDLVFGGSVSAVDVAIVDGRWTLRVGIKEGEASSERTIGLDYDEAHRRLASRIGWDGLPAPASRVMRTTKGFTAEGVGFGHRVGLCLSP
jgi:hypothetical protein